MTAREKVIIKARVLASLSYSISETVLAHATEEEVEECLKRIEEEIKKLKAFMEEQ